MDRKAQVAQELTAVRSKTLWLLEQVPDEFLRRRVHSFYSPIGWHFGHVGRTEEFWVCEATGEQPNDAHLSFLYADLPENPKDNRVNIPDRTGTIEYLQRTRDFALEVLARADLSSDNPLLGDGYAWQFAIQHECQHQETIAEMLCLIHKARDERQAVPVADLGKGAKAKFVEIPEGTFSMGTDDFHAYDNEKRCHEVRVEAFRLATTPVTVGQWLEFVADGGYQRRELWCPAGWAWRCEEEVELPEYWFSDGGRWFSFGATGPRPLSKDEPAMSLSWFEADAFARWSRKRLPTEAEWEYAASGMAYRIFPWGDHSPSDALARYGLKEMGPCEVGRHPKGASPFGCQDMAGNCWEWTSSKFLPYPGFEAFPYDGYSKEHMKGEHYVCRGGSWATAGPILRCSFRNWYVPSYRQGFLGVRLAE